MSMLFEEVFGLQLLVKFGNIGTNIFLKASG